MPIFLHILLADAAFSQNQKKDVVYLKNGSIIKGEIIEQIPNKSIKIQTSDGNIFVYDISDIEKMTKETTTSQTKIKTEESSSNETEVLKGGFIVSGGLSVPVGDFGGTSDISKNSCAKTGYSFSVEYDAPLNKILFGLLSVTYSSNSVDGASFMKGVGYTYSGDNVDVGSFSLIAPMAGIGVQSQIAPTMALYLSAQIGIMLAFQPEVTIRSNGIQLFNETSTNATAFSYGISGGIKIGERFIVGFRYISASPKYDEKGSVLMVNTYSGSLYTQNISDTSERSASVLLLQVGVIF
jgi:hypothetical protein